MVEYTDVPGKTVALKAIKTRLDRSAHYVGRDAPTCKDFNQYRVRQLSRVRQLIHLKDAQRGLTHLDESRRSRDEISRKAILASQHTYAEQQYRPV